MIFLARHLRQLEPEKFQQLCFHILKAKYPGADLKYVEGSGGDKGLDIFAGLLSDGPVIWQCKCFNGKVHSAQKRQIKHSLVTALKNFKPRRWILCISANLTTSGQLWFQGLQKEYAGRVSVELFQASDIEYELSLRRTILDAFFPNLQLNTSKIKALTTKIDQLTTTQLGDVAEENVDQLKRRLEEKDARYSHKVTFPQESVPPSVLELTQRAPEPGLVMSVHDGVKLIDFYARDPQSLALDPPKFRMRLQESDVEKLDIAIKRGTPEELSTAEILELPSAMAELLPSDSTQNWKVSVGPTHPPNVPVILRTAFGSPPNHVVYEAIQYRIKRLGTEEVEIESVDTHLPFVLSIILRLHGPLIMTFRARWEGKDIHAVHKWCKALDIIEAGGDLELYDIKHEGHLALASIPASPKAILSRSKEIVRDLLELAERYGVPVRVPRTLTREDRENLGFALQAATSGRVVQEDVERISFDLKRNEAVTPENFGTLALGTSFSMVYPQGRIRLRIGDNEIDPGPYTMYCHRAVLADFERTKEAFFSANHDETVRIALEPRAPVELFFHRFLPQPPPMAAR
jgi:hypothetical protein